MTPLVPGLATGVGSLPHLEADDAVAAVLAVHRTFPSAPQLPERDAREGMLVQWLRALPEVEVGADGGFTADPRRAGEVRPQLDDDAHGGLLAFLSTCAALPEPPARVKLQLTGPLTLGLALLDAGLPTGRAFGRAAEAVRAWSDLLVRRCHRMLPNTHPVVVLDEPGLVVWQRDDDPPLGHEEATDLLSGALAEIDAATGVHVCGDGHRRMALEAGPDLLSFPVRPEVLGDAVALGRFLEAGGWLAWGAIPTDRPVGDQADHWWRVLVGLWCDLTRAGCDPTRLRTQAVITPGCGLAHHGQRQAERILGLTVDLAERVRQQAVATRLSVGA